MIAVVTSAIVMELVLKKQAQRIVAVLTANAVHTQDMGQHKKKKGGRV